MAMSLEDLLAKEGFRGRRLKSTHRASFGSEPSSHALRGQHKSASSSSGLKKTERTKSDVVPRYGFSGEFPPSDRVNSRRREKLDRKSKDTREKLDGRDSRDTPRKEIIEIGVQDDKRYIEIYSNELYSPASIKGTHSNETGERETYRRSNSSKHRLGRISSIDDYQKNTKQPEPSYNRSNTSSQNSKSFDESRTQRKAEIERTVAQLALDEVAIKAIICILSGYIKPFLKDKDFRTSLRHNCFASLNFAGLEEEGLDAESKVIENLEQAIEVVERAAEERASANEVKKAMLQLSLITGLSINDLKDGFTSGIQNCKLSACAHLYLSVIYKLQKKDRIASKHLLQMFCESTFQARTILLPELWENIFLPHLSHLKVWYNQEADSIADLPNKARKLKLLEKVYNEILDSGTYQFAVYYKDWLTEGVEAPSVPSIHIPSVSVHGVKHGDLSSHSSDVGSPRGPFSPQPMVSKKLYDAVFNRLRKPGADEVEYSSVLSSDGSTVEDKRTLNELHQTEFADLDISSHPVVQINVSYIIPKTSVGMSSFRIREAQSRLIIQPQEDGQTDENTWRLHRASTLGERTIHGQIGNSHLWQGASTSSHTLYALPNTKANELTLEKLAKSVFAMQQDLVDSTLVLHSEDALHPVPLPTTIKCLDEDTDETYKSFDRERFFSSIPEDFICPLTGLVFEDPVTLETGQNFERVAVIEWFNKGNTTCPVTKNELERQSVPFTNFILKRVIDSWKSEHCRNLLAFASQIVDTSGEHTKFKNEAAVVILEQLLTVFCKEEVLKNAKYLISLGGLQFLIRRFEYGNLEEKSSVAAMLICCIEEESGCRNQIARNIEKSGLLELIHSKQVKSRENAVVLLTELICLNRRKDVEFLLSGLLKEGIDNTMQCLLLYLQSCTHELRPLVAVLLLHLDLLIEEPNKHSIYREEAVDALTVAMDISLSDEKVREKCCRAVLILGGRFSSSGKLMTEDWILKQAGFLQGPDHEEDKILVENIPLDGNEEEDREEWLTNLSASLLGGGKKSFLEAVSTCLGSGNLVMVRVCLITVAWLSSALPSLPDADEFQLSSFSAFISPLKECLENGERVEHRILASMSLFNFSKIPECRILLMTIGEEIAIPLGRLAEVTWTAKELYAVVSHQHL
ncbi:hypothetical protein LguiB_032267 [Lonicera macranthoides]